MPASVTAIASLSEVLREQYSQRSVYRTFPRLQGQWLEAIQNDYFFHSNNVAPAADAGQAVPTPPVSSSPGGMASQLVIGGSFDVSPRSGEAPRPQSQPRAASRASKETSMSVMQRPRPVRWMISQPVVLARKSTERVRLIPEVDIREIRCDVLRGSDACYVQGFRLGKRKMKPSDPMMVLKRGEPIELQVRNSGTMPQRCLVALRGIVAVAPKKMKKGVAPSVIAAGLSGSDLLLACGKCDCIDCVNDMDNRPERRTYYERTYVTMAANGTLNAI